MTRRDAGPIACVLLAALAIWYALSAWLNWDQARALAGDDAGTRAVLAATMGLSRPLLPSPHQVVGTVLDGVLNWPLTSPRSLLYHAGVTAGAAALGFALALAVGLLLAAAIVHSRVLDRSLMPWLIASQTVPVLAIAPMVVVVLGNLGLTGLIPKALIAAWLAFLPVTLGAVKGLRSPDPVQRDLLRTYAATPAQTFWALRWPASMTHLLPGVRVAAALALVGTIVAELPTGAQAGLGARLLAGSYYGQTVQIWAALAMAALLSLVGTGLVSLTQGAVTRRRGGRL